jgi:hypothetical protein
MFVCASAFVAWLGHRAELPWPVAIFQFLLAGLGGVLAVDVFEWWVQRRSDRLRGQPTRHNRTRF